MRISLSSWLVGFSLLLGGMARAAPEVVIEGERELVSQDFGDKTDVHIRANATLHAAPGATLELKARRFIFEGPVTIDARGAPGLPGEAAPDRSDARLDIGSPEVPPLCALDETDRGPAGLPGKPGTPGALVTFRAEEFPGREQVQFLATGGKGGAGGAGGKGRLLHCMGEQMMNLVGATGPNGPPGQDGADGQLLFNEAPDPGADPVSFTVTVSGGISLGSYEAGYNWALVREIKKRAAVKRRREDPPLLDLAAVTGASAGSINTFLSAISWCQTAEEDQKESAVTNIFHKTWVPIGLPELIPPDDVYAPSDALLSTTAFASVGATLMARMAQPVFREGCALPIGMTVTRTEPDVIHGEPLEAPLERHSVALEARTVGGTLKFFDARPDDESAYVRPYLHFTDPNASGGGADVPVPMLDVMQVLVASSAFPVAFGQQNLSYYAASPTDPLHLTRTSDWFWDGGLYDAIPVGLALSFVEKPLFGRTRPAGRFQMFAIDPERRRDVVLLPADPPNPWKPPKGVGNLEKIAGSFLSVSRKYELQSFIRFALPQLSEACKKAQGDTLVANGFGSCTGDPLLSSRFAPVFGERLGAFGAFVLEAFREFDFAAGIYDALQAFAKRDCEWQRLRADNPGELFMEQCMVQQIHAGYQELHLSREDSAIAGFLVKSLMREELVAFGGEARADRILKSVSVGGQSAADWVAFRPSGVPPYVDTLLADAKRVLAQGRRDNLETELAQIERLARKLAKDASLPAPDRDLLVDDDWFGTNTRRLLNRAEDIEREDHYPAGKSVTTTALFLARTSQSLWRTGMQWDPSSVPDGWASGRGWHLLPYHLSFSLDVVQAGWLPTIGFTDWLAMGFPLSASATWGTLYPYRVAGHAGVSLIFRPPNLWIPAIEVSPLRVTINEVGRLEDPMYGFEAAVYLLGGKIRLALAADIYHVGTRWLPEETTRITVGVADLNGILFYLGR